MLTEKPTTFFRHFGEELAVTIGETEKTVIGIYNESTTASSNGESRADVLNTRPSVEVFGSDVEGITIGDTVTRAEKLYYVVDWVAGANFITLFLSEDQV